MMKDIFESKPVLKKDKTDFKSRVNSVKNKLELLNLQTHAKELKKR